MGLGLGLRLWSVLGLGLGWRQLVTLFAQALDASGARERMIWIIGATSGAPSWEKRAKARGVSAVHVKGSTPPGQG